MTYRVIDLFCGAGGMTLGFVDKRFGGGFKCVLAVDNEPAAIATHAEAFGGQSVPGNIEDWLKKKPKIPQADVVIGGPPCQGFSLLNKNREGDVRRALWEPYMDIVKASGAKVFVMENVKELIKSAEFDDIRRRAEKMGFEIRAEILNAADYGAPQIRRRAVVVGWNKKAGISRPEFPPEATHSAPGGKDNLPDWVTVKEAIGNLPDPIGTEIRQMEEHSNDAHLDLHFGRNPTAVSLARYKVVPPGGNRFDLHKNAPELTPPCWVRKTSGGTDLFGRLWWDKPSVTIRTEFFKPEKGRYLHPEKHRPITHREAARLMGFPDDFKFSGSKTEVARQIGNAVCPPFAGAISKMVRAMLDEAQIDKAA
jgi:DNA (cytosine-5)-methyltransferase 1